MTLPDPKQRPIIVTITAPAGVNVQPRQYECATAHLGDGGALVLRNAVPLINGWAGLPSDGPIPFLVTNIGPGWEATIDGHLHGV